MTSLVGWGIGLSLAAMVTVTWLLIRRRRTAMGRGSRPLPDAERWRRIQDLMVHALTLPVEDREAFVRTETEGDQALSEEVLSLLTETEREGMLDELTDAVVQPFLSAGPIGSRRTVGHYVIEEEIGRGGMGVVHRARDARLDRMVALKFLPPWASSDPEAKQRFLLEARAAAALDHPNVCTIHEIGDTEEGLLFIAMPCYEGETLGARLAGGALPSRDAVAVAMQVGRGLAKAHERGIVHRDVKPANVMITEDGVAKVLDFGVAKLSTSQTRGTGAQPGTLAYMSPEQAAGGEVDHRTDIWALGVLLYEMLSGRRPFDGRGDAALLHAILTTDPIPPGTSDQPVPAELERILQRALARDPAERYDDIGSMVADLEERAARQVSAEASGAHRSGRAPPGSVPFEGERRTVTVLVASIAACLEAFERLSPEEADAAMRELGEVASHVMRSHGGIVNDVTGEEVICLFGVPSAHEDDYVRAVRAAVDLQEAAGRIEAFRTGLQSGIETGPVLVRLSQGDGRPYQVAGEALRMARLLSTQAGPGAVLVSPRCQRLVAPYYLTVPSEPIAGLRTEIRLTPHRVLGKSGFETRLEATRTADLSHHIGRDAGRRAQRDAGRRGNDDTDRGGGGAGEEPAPLRVCPRP
jgi:class 3 adenylate cyclase